MADKILHKRSLTPGSVPTTSSLETGELAVNVNDGKLFLRQSGSVDQIVNVGESASFAATASYVQTAQTASYVVTAQTASYVLNAVSSSFATTASFAASASWAPVSNPFPFTGSALITGSLGVTGSLTATQIGAGAAPSGSVRLDVRAQGALSTDIAFRVRNSADSATFFTVRGDQAIEMIRENPATNGGILITKTDTYNTPRIQMYNVFSQLIDINAGTQTITTFNIKCGNSGAAGFLGFTTPTGQERYLKFVNLFGQETLSIGGNNYDGIATFTMKSWAGTTPGNVFTIIKSDNTNPFVITDQARVGIGNNSPGARLDVRAQGALSTDIAFRVRNSADTQNLFSLSGNGNFTLGLANSYYIALNPSSPSLRGYNSTNVAWQLSPWTGEHCWLTNVQSNQVQVGIGITTPTSKLHVYTVEADTAIKIATGIGTAADETACLKFATTFAGTSFGSDAAIIRARSKGTNSADQKCAVEFSLNRNGTTALKASITSQSNLLLQTPTEDTADIGVIYVPTGTSPTASIVDGFKQYSADIVAGNAAPHFRTENGSIIKLYQETTGVAAATLVSNAGTALTSTDTFDGYTLQQVVKALRNLGILA
jgi:hypothetical protein